MVSISFVGLQDAAAAAPLPVGEAGDERG